MRYFRYNCVIIALFVIFLIPFSSCESFDTHLKVKSRLKMQNPEYYVDHDPIIINSNYEFVDMAELEYWPGDGSTDNPYIIQGYRTKFIHISNICQNFVICDNYIVGDKSKSGISIRRSQGNKSILRNKIINVTKGIDIDSCNVSIISNSIIGAYTGIRISGSRNLVTDNFCENCSEGITLMFTNLNGVLRNVLRKCYLGIYLSCAADQLISENTITDGTTGIMLEYSPFNTVRKNFIVYNNDTGIEVYRRCRSSLIIDNIIRLNGGNGIDVIDPVEIINNTVTNNAHHGIRVYITEGAKVISNTVIANGGHGIFINWSNETVVESNTALRNDGQGICVKDSYEVINTDNHISDNKELEVEDYGIPSFLMPLAILSLIVLVLRKKKNDNKTSD